MVSEGSNTICNSVLYLFILCMFGAKDFQENIWKCNKFVGLSLDTCVVNKVTEVAEAIEKLWSRDVGIILELFFEVPMSILLNNLLSSCLENFNELTSALHDLGGNFGNFGSLFKEFFNVFLVKLFLSFFLLECIKVCLFVLFG